MTPNAMPIRKPATPPAPRKARTPRPIRNTALADQLRQKGFAK